MQHATRRGGTCAFCASCTCVLALLLAGCSRSGGSSAEPAAAMTSAAAGGLPPTAAGASTAPHAAGSTGFAAIAGNTAVVATTGGSANKPSGATTNAGTPAAASEPMQRSAGGAGTGSQPSAAGNSGAASSAPNEWRMMGYDEKNWFYNPAETALTLQNASQLEEKWRFTVSGFPIGSPVIAEGKVFAMAQGGTYAIDLQTGQQLWSRSDIVGSAAVAYQDGFLYVQHSAIPPLVYKLSAADGSTVWGPVKNCQNDKACSGESSPIIVGNTVYVGMESNILESSFDAADAVGARGAVRALAADSGELRWLYYTIPEADPNAESGAAVWSTVSVDPSRGLVFATTGNNYTVAGPNGDAFHAIDLTMGSKRWVNQVREGDVFTVATALTGEAKGFDFDFGANPILAELDGKSLVAAGDKGGAFWVLDRELGTLLWHRDDLSPSSDATFGGIFINGGFDGQAFYVVSNDPMNAGAVLHRLDPRQNGASTWRHVFHEATWGAVSLANGLLFVPSNANLYVMNALTGDVLTQFDTGGTIAGGAPAVAQGRIVVKSGFLYKDPATKANDQIICYALPSAAGATSAAAESGSAGAPAPAANSFSAIYREIILDAGCNSGQCHSAFAAGKLDMSTQAAAHMNLVGVTAMGMTLPGAAAPGCNGSGLKRVVPGDPEHSLLLAKIEHTQTCGEAMPTAAVRLPDAQRQAIRAWIQAGAPPN